MGVPVRPNISLSTFGEFIVASASGRVGAVRRALELYERDYKPKLDFYLPWREAAQECLAMGNDALAMRRALAAATGRQAPHFTELQAGWALLRRRSALTLPHGEGWTWHHEAIDMRVRPSATLLDRGVTRQVAFYLKQDPLTADAARAMLWVMNASRPGDYAVLDVRRGTIVRPRRNASRDIGLWVGTEASAFAHMWRTLAKAA